MLYQEIDQEIELHKSYSLRRQLGIPTSRRLWVLTCMDERFIVEDVLGLNEGDAHIFRNAGGVVTDDAIRSAIITTQFFGAKEIIVLAHTECGILRSTGEAMIKALEEKGVRFEDEVAIDPALPELKLKKELLHKWFKTYPDIDEACLHQVELLRNCPFIPKDVVIHGYIWEVENRKLRKPGEMLSRKVNTSEEMGCFKMQKVL